MISNRQKRAGSHVVSGASFLERSLVVLRKSTEFPKIRKFLAVSPIFGEFQSFIQK